MKVRLLAQAVTVGLLLMIIASAMPASAQSAPPTSLRVEIAGLYPTPAGTMQNGTAPAAAPCGPAVTASPTGGSAESTFSYTLPFNGSFHFRDPVTFTVRLVAPGTSPVASGGVQGGTLTGTLGTGGTGMVATTPIGAGTAAATVYSLAFSPGENATVGASGEPVTLKIGIETTAGGNIQVQCGPDTGATSVLLYRGGPGAGDLDGDGIPDLEDADRDGDGVLNTAEPGTCAFFTPPQAYADNPRIRTGADSDGDGANDEVECAAVPPTNPESNTSFPPRPRGIVEILLPWILLLVVLGLIAGIVFVFMKYGKTVGVTVVSQPELFIPPGSKGKYEVAVENLAKKGEARTYQLAVAGMPEGWDAKLNTDHLTLEPQGGATAKQSVWLEVEAPAHNEPESAVVSVKATPLNKAGRKDTFKLGGKAETITSINVPPGSKVPVKRGGKVTAAAAKEEAAPKEDDTNAMMKPVQTIEGIGETYAPKLEKMGITTVGQMRTADTAAVAKKTGAPEVTVQQWKQMAELMQVHGIGQQYSELLVKSGVTSIAQLAESKPKEVAAKIAATNAQRSVPIQGNEIGEKSAKNWIKAAAKFQKSAPAAAPAPAAAAPAAAAAAAPAAAAAAPSAAKPQLQVGGLRHDPPAFRQGDAVKSTVNVANNGKDKSTIKLSLFVNDGLADVQTVTVKGGKAQDVQFKWTAQEKNKLNIRGEIVPG